MVPFWILTVVCVALLGALIWSLRRLYQIKLDAAGAPPQGRRGRSLPQDRLDELLTMLLADYYQKLSSVWTRLKGLMVYPVIVMTAALALSVGLALFLGNALGDTIHLLEATGFRPGSTPVAMALLPVQVWGPVALLALGTTALLLMLLVPRLRWALKWKLPGLREASLSQFANSLALMLSQGNTNSDLRTGTEDSGTNAIRSIWFVSSVE